MASDMSRRTFLSASATVLAGAAISGCQVSPASTVAPATTGTIPVIDTHIHLYDPFRPGGVPWPGKDNLALYKTTLPSRYRPIAEPLGIVGAIEVECSPLLEDNQWVLDVAGKDDIMVGTIGNLVPGTPGFRASLDRFRKNPLFRGIRYRPDGLPGPEANQPAFFEDLKYLADADLVLDTANPSVELLSVMVRSSDSAPHLRIIIDHLPQMVPPTDAAAKASFAGSMKAFRDRPQIYVKISEVLRRQPDGTIPTDLSFYRPRLDKILEVFGHDRVLFGSDWPNSDQWLPVPTTFKIVQEYFMSQGRPAAEKYFWRNSIKCYRWIKRTAAQSKLV